MHSIIAAQNYVRLHQEQSTLVPLGLHRDTRYIQVLCHHQCGYLTLFWQAPDYSPSTSAVMKQMLAKGNAQEWNTRMQPVAAVVNAILCATHLELYNAAKATIAALRSERQFDAALDCWPSMFSAMALMSNRQTPRHRDNKTWHTFYDIILTVGQYNVADFAITGLGASLNYSPGTIVALCAAILEHAVEVETGERVCWVFYMRRDIFQYAGVKIPHWAELDRT